MTTILRDLFYKAVLPVLAILMMVVVTLFAVKAFLKGDKHRHPGSPGSVELVVGSKVPDFSLWTLDGKEVLFSSLSSKVILINFWATWCEACVLEMPSIVKLRNDFKDKGFEAIGISVDEEPLAVVPSALKRLQIDFPIFVDKGNKLVDLFDIHGIPLTFILDKNRKIVMIETGERDWNSKETRAQLEKWLAP